MRAALAVGLALWAGTLGLPIAAQDGVACLQAQLRDLGHDPGPVDGTMRPAVRDAAQAWGGGDAFPDLRRRTATSWCRELGIANPLAAVRDRVRAADGLLHVSLDVDFLDPSIAPAVGTTVPGGATLREAHLVMEMICDSGSMTSLDLVELNPFLDERGRTAQVMVDLVASAFGRRVFDRPTRAY